MVIINNPGSEEVLGRPVDVVAADCLQGLLYYLAVYLFMNLGAFAIVAIIRPWLPRGKMQRKTQRDRPPWRCGRGARGGGEPDPPANSWIGPYRGARGPR